MHTKGLLGWLWGNVTAVIMCKQVYILLDEIWIEVPKDQILAWAFLLLIEHAICPAFPKPDLLMS